jgi:hypothetical protein
MEFHLHRGRLQSDPPPQAAGDLMPSRKNPLLGRWRITEMELWNTDFVDLLEPAYITFEAKGGGEFVFGAVRGDLDCRYGPDGVRFTWEGNDEMDPAFGAGSAKCAPDGSLTGEICFHRGDESTFKARKW